MEFQDVLNARKSIRKYDPEKKVSKEQIEEIIEAAILGPTWKNSQTGRYHIAYSKEAFEAVKNCLPEFNVKNTIGASAYIVTTFVKDDSGCDPEGKPYTELAHNEWGVYDLGLANANLILKASDLGLGTLIMGIRDADGLRKALNIPDNEIIIAVISLGYPAADPKRPGRKTVEEVAKFA